MKYKAKPSLSATLTISQRVGNSIVSADFRLIFDREGIFDLDGFMNSLKELITKRMDLSTVMERLPEGEPEEESKTLNEVIEEVKEPAKTYKCKKCDFETNNKGLLLAHYRNEHPTEEGAKE